MSDATMMPCPFCLGAGEIHGDDCQCDDGQVTRFIKIDHPLMMDKEEPDVSRGRTGVVRRLDIEAWGGAFGEG